MHCEPDASAPEQLWTLRQLRLQVLDHRPASERVLTLDHLVGVDEFHEAINSRLSR